MKSRRREREGEEMNESWKIKINEEKVCGRLLQVIHGRKTDKAGTKIITTFHRRVFSSFSISVYPRRTYHSL